MLFRRFYALMDAAAGGEGGEAGGGTADPAAGGGDPAGAAAAPTGSVLQTGAADAPPAEFIPEKYRVTKDDGSLDLDASARKLADAHTHLEKRLGSGDAPPKSADEYTVTVPDELKDAFDPKTDEGFKAFAGKMHELGLTQKQLDGVMSHYFELAPKLVAGAAMLDADGAKAQLEQAWGQNGGFQHQIRNAYQGASALAQKAGISIDEIMSPTGLGNNVQFLRLMAAIGPEFAEDTSPGGTSMGGPTTEEQIHELMRGDAYKDTRHPDHEKVSKQVRAFFERKHGTQPVG